MKSNFLKKIALGVVVVTVFFSAKSNASLSYTLSTTVNGTSPTSTEPWLTAVFENVTGGVKLTLTSSLDVGSEFITAVGFNLNPSLTPTAPAMLTGNANAITAGVNNLQVNGNAVSGFDFVITWLSSNAGGGANRFNGNDVNTFFFSGLDENDFNYANASGTYTGLFIAAKVQGIPPQSASGDIAAYGPDENTPAIPEPSTVVAGALLLLPFGISTLRILRKRPTA
jgi:hypothetical protein